MKNKIAFLTTIFPIKTIIIDVFFESLKCQVYTSFDIIVVNDGYKNFNSIKEKYSDLNIIELKHSNTPAKNREFGINFVKNSGYEIVVFGDCDDYFSPNRIQIAIKKLKIFDIVVNDISLFNDNGIISSDYFSKRIDNNTRIKPSYIKDKNIFGLSNTAIKLNIIDNVKFDKNLIALDWYLFSLLLIKGYRAVFTNESKSYYRQYLDNTIGLGIITRESILKGILVKIKHYELMKQETSIFDELLSEIYELKDKVKDVRYIDKLKNCSKVNLFWWEEIQDTI